MKNENLIFHITTWDQHHEIDVNEKRYVIYMCGTTLDNKKICVKVKGFQPYFFVKIPKTWTSFAVTQFIALLKNKVYAREKESLCKHKIVRKHKFTKFTNYKEYRFIKLSFTSHTGYKAYERVLRKKLKTPFKNKKSFQLFESNLEPVLRFIHARNLEACGWAQIEYYENTKGRSNCDIEIEANWSDVNFYDSRKIAGLTIASFDLECISVSGGFPQAALDKDAIIQIGTTFSRYGESECYYKHLITLGSCGPINGVTVESWKSEKNVILAWAKLIKKMDPDIITGFNIFQFDYLYIRDRAQKFGIEHEFLKLVSRVKCLNTVFLEKQLASSALGDNFLKFYEMPGRIQIDIMKIVQRDYKLASYSLDNVASEFIKEKVISVETNNEVSHISDQIQKKVLELGIPIKGTATIVTNNVYGLEVDSFIKIYFNDNYSDNIFDNNKKYKILGLAEFKDPTTNKNFKLIIVNNLINPEICDLLTEVNTSTGEKSNTVYWTQAKDDLKYSTMFKMHMTGTSKDRAIIGKYCIKDCTLCNVLINKLEVLNNNVAMANVTHVPLSYIFLKGQGVKIFSLIAKKCRERNHLIPVLKPKNKTQEELDEEKVLDKIKSKMSRMKAKKTKISSYTNTSILSYVESGKDNDTSDSDESDDEYSYDGSDFAEHEFNKEERDKEEHKLTHIYDSDSDDDDNSYFKRANFYNNNNGYEGATVLDPDAGIHHTPIPVLDFASLYPSSMIEGNLSHECLILDDKYLTDKIREEYTLYTVTYYNTDIKRTQNTCVYAIKKDRSVVGILPEILLNLIAARSDTKKLMENTQDPFQKKVLDGRQLALKITANSLYGQTGATTSPVSQKKIAASTTSIGRDRLMAAKRFAEEVFPLLVKPIIQNNSKLYYDRINCLFDNSTCENINMFPGNPVISRLFNNPKNGYTNREEFIKSFENEIKKTLCNKDINPKCIYGDSVLGDEPLILMNQDGDIEIKKIEDLVIETDWKPYDSFKTDEFNNHFINVLNTLFGFSVKTTFDSSTLVLEDDEQIYQYMLTKDQYIIKKNMILYDAIDRNYIIDYWKNSGAIPTGELIINRLLTELPALVKHNLMDFKLHYKNGNKLDIRRKNIILLDPNGNKIKSIDYFIGLFNSLKVEKEYCVSNYKVWTDDGWKYIHKVIRHASDKKIYNVQTNFGIVSVTEDHSLLDKNKRIIRPIDCNMKTELLHSFPTLDDLDGVEGLNLDTSCNVFMSKDKVECMKYYFVNRVRGKNVKIESVNEMYRLSIVDYLETDWSVKSMTSFNGATNNRIQYVYDLETENGHFNAGIGALTLKNTDSIFINFNIFDNVEKKLMKDKKSLEIGIKLGKLCSRVIGTILPYPQDLQYEKTFWPFIIITKKRYVGKKYEHDTEHYCQTSMGLSLKRRDYAPIAKIIVGKIVNTILNESDLEKAIVCTKDELLKILSNHYPIDKFILSKTLRSEYADRTRMVHAVLADRIAVRDPGNKPQSNDRVQYVYIVTGKNMKDIKLQGERVEDPAYALEHNLQLDYLFYITNQILKPAIQFLEYIVHEPERIFNAYINYELNRRAGLVPIRYYFSEIEDEQDVQDMVDGFDDLNDDKLGVKKIVRKVPSFDKKLVNKTKKKVIDSDDKSMKKTKKKVIDSDDEYAKKTKKKVINSDDESMKKTKKKVINSNNKPMKKTKKKVIDSDDEYAKKTKKKVIDSDDEYAKKTKKKVIDSDDEPIKKTKKKVIDSDEEPMKKAKKKVIDSDEEPMKKTKKKVIDSDEEPIKKTKKKVIDSDEEPMKKAKKTVLNSGNEYVNKAKKKAVDSDKETIKTPTKKVVTKKPTNKLVKSKMSNKEKLAMLNDNDYSDFE
jgi:DNA polymerase elongation subunit (family B)